MNNLAHLKNAGAGKRVYLIGNGPSLTPELLDSIKVEDSIAMNRIAMIYPQTAWRPTFYVFTSDNCRNPQWGRAWSADVARAAWEIETTPIIWRRYKLAIEHNSGETLPERTLWLERVSETWDFSDYANERVDKAGTTMFVALQLAYWMKYAETYLLGCDSHWQTATNTPSTGDPNHFSPDYHAHIGDGAAEFKRMNRAHEIAREHFDAAGLRIFNATPGSAITAYERANDKADSRHE